VCDLVTVYVSIGNSDDKLPQARWHEYWIALRELVVRYAVEVHGEWLSIPVSPYQNACLCFDVLPDDVTPVKRELAGLAGRFGQHSIAWAEAQTEFLIPA